MINLKLRFKNKVSLIALIAAILTFVYYLLDMFGVVPKFSYDQIFEACMLLINVLVILGIITDPTTSGIGDSTQVLTYEAPKNTVPDEEFDDTED